ncbi:MAG: DUF1003 domain-containing protein [Pyrinomonadaceae bacterium]
MFQIIEKSQTRQIGQEAFDEPASIVCPACGNENASDAVFCAGGECHKALGEFKYVAEELRAETRWHEALAERVSAFIAKPTFLAVHAFWFAVWVTVNTGIPAFSQIFDAYPFGLLGIILAVEAIFITGFLLISQNRQSVHADKRAELDYEVNVRTYREIQRIKSMLQGLELDVSEIKTAARTR